MIAGHLQLSKLHNLRWRWRGFYVHVIKMCNVTFSCDCSRRLFYFSSEIPRCIKRGVCSTTVWSGPPSVCGYFSSCGRSLWGHALPFTSSLSVHPVRPSALTGAICAHVCQVDSHPSALSLRARFRASPWRKVSCHCRPLNQKTNLIRAPLCGSSPQDGGLWNVDFCHISAALLSWALH